MSLHNTNTTLARGSNVKRVTQTQHSCTLTLELKPRTNLTDWESTPTDSLTDIKWARAARVQLDSAGGGRTESGRSGEGRNSVEGNIVKLFPDPEWNCHSGGGGSPFTTPCGNVKSMVLDCWCHAPVEEWWKERGVDGEGDKYYTWILLPLCFCYDFVLFYYQQYSTGGIGSK